jgi:uncharacterized protein DUF4157
MPLLSRASQQTAAIVYSRRREGVVMQPPAPIVKPEAARADRAAAEPTTAPPRIDLRADLARLYAAVGNQAVLRMRRAAPPPSGTPIQRKCGCAAGSGGCEECAIQRRTDGAAAPVPVDLSRAVEVVLRSPGRPLDATTRSFFEGRLAGVAHRVRAAPPAPGQVSGPRDGAEVEADRIAGELTGAPPAAGTARLDLGDVRVHTDDSAGRSAQQLGARAFTVGAHVVFSPGSYAPGSAAGRDLLAHELTHVVQQRGGAGGVQRQVALDTRPLIAATAGNRTTLTIVDYIHPHRVVLEVVESTLQGRQSFAYELVPVEQGLRSHVILRIVAAPGVAITAEGWPTGPFIVGPENPGLEVYRVQDPAAVPPQGEPIVPARYVGERNPLAAGPYSLAPPPFLVRSTESSVDITHLPTRTTVHITVRNLAGTDRFAYEVVDAPLRGGSPEIRIVKTPSVPILVRGPAEAVLMGLHVWVVDHVADVPAQGRPLSPIGRELTSIPAEVQLTLEQEAACAIVPLAISLIPIVGQIYMIGDFVYGLATGRDPLCRQRRDALGHVMAGLGALIGVVDLGLRGVGIIAAALRTSRASAQGLAIAVGELSATDRALVTRVNAAVARGEAVAAADTEAIARLLARLDSRAVQLGGAGGVADLLNAERSGFIEPEVQAAYQRYLAGAGDHPLAPEAWARTGEGEGAIRTALGEPARPVEPRPAEPAATERGPTEGGEPAPRRAVPDTAAAPHEPRLPRELRGICRIGSLDCDSIPRFAQREAGAYPTPDRVPRPRGPFRLRGTTDPDYLDLRAITGEALQRIYLDNPQLWTAQFRRAYRAAGNTWPTDAAGRAWQVHHVHPLDFGGGNEAANLVALEHDVHAPYTTWWGRVKASMRRQFIEGGNNIEQWRALIRGEFDVAYEDTY